MSEWNVFFEDADTDEPRRYLGVVRADTASEALNLAAQFYEIHSTISSRNAREDE